MYLCVYMCVYTHTHRKREKEIYYLISANTITEAEEYRNWLCAGRGHREVWYNSKT